MTQIKPWTRQSLIAAFLARSARDVARALALYWQGYKGDKSLANFADHVDRWLVKVEPDAAGCKHAWTDKFTNLDAYPNGLRKVERVCRSCEAVKPGSTREFWPDCPHDWHVVDVSGASAEIAKKLGAKSSIYCRLCGRDQAPNGEGVLQGDALVGVRP